jgi:BirA family biotin operon repressor/biotin-[acetyl-CoA-carboxylase] ligase
MTPRARKRIGWRVLRYACLESTNSTALEYVGDPSNDGLVILADEQTAGRGQYGRSWTCSSGEGLLMSVVVFPPETVRHAPILAAWAAISVCETIHPLVSQPPRIKWPNDILVSGKKVAGILVEQGAATVIGIGVNVRQTAGSFAANGLADAGSLAMFANQPPDRDAVLSTLLTELDGHYEQLRQGSVTTLVEMWNDRLGLEGKKVTVVTLQGKRDGVLQQVNGRVVRIEANGKHEEIPAETIRQIMEIQAG